MGSSVDTAGLLDGRAALVSGVGPGLGRAIALGLAAAGADVAVSARREAPLRAVAAEVEALGRRAVVVPADIADPEAGRRLADAAAAGLGRLDVLVNNAFAEEDWREPFDGLDPARWREPMDVNLFGTLRLTQAAIPHLRAAGGGSVVMITTLSVRNPIPLLAGYAASKAALTTAAHVLATELGLDGIRVNCVAPGHIDGPPLREYFEWIAARRGIEADDVREEVASLNPLHHVPTSEEIAPAVVFLASPLASAITGQTLDVNCGRTMS